MHTLFDNVPAMNHGLIRIPDFLYIKGGMSRDLADVLQYGHTKVRAVNSGHFLVRLIHSMNVSMARSYESYVDIAEERGSDLARTLKMTTPVSTGHVFTPGVFYGKDVTEVIVSVTNMFDVDEAVRRWRELEPIRVLRHPFDDVNMKVPYGNYDYVRKGIAVIAIDIPMLMLQYRRWYEVEKSINPEADRTVMQFIAMYPIPNMVPSHLDVALFNRMETIYYGGVPTPFVPEHKFHITDFSRKIDSSIEKQLALLSVKRLRFDELLTMSPAISRNNMFEVMELPDVARTRQITWALILARLPVIRFLLRLNDDASNEANRYYLNRIRNSLREIKNDRTLRSALPYELFVEVEQTIENNIAAYL